MRVMVTGGAGYIGSHAVRELLDRGHRVVVYDNLSTGFRTAVDDRAEFIFGNTNSFEGLNSAFRAHGIEAVLHFAANIEVGESVLNPHKYYQNNLGNTLNLLMAMRDAQVNKIIFSSTAAVYGNPEKCPIVESHPRLAINPYGRSKLMTEMVLEDFAAAYGLKYAVLRYFNVAGAHPEGDIGEAHDPETHLIPRVLKATLDPWAEVKIFGTDYPTSDGTCIRDYIHVMDLIDAHILALESLGSEKCEVYNLGNERGFSVKEIIKTCEAVTGRKLSVKEEARRAGDPATLIASSEKIRKYLGWKPQYTHLEDIVKHAWQWHRTHPQGYKTVEPLLQNDVIYL
ncbi:UDP-glucose 4-epimerase GalE [Bdellovibrio sp. HCB-162]|uniref:UDP-glucose 4-epimerase GalE n=1 Tax=Bdellovibrio sp. HCB-162 TaxID=3394234 RepID=UPI0039BCAE1E